MNSPAQHYQNLEDKPAEIQQHAMELIEKYNQLQTSKTTDGNKDFKVDKLYKELMSYCQQNAIRIRSAIKKLK